MRLDLVLLSVAFAGLAGSLAGMVILLKRAAFAVCCAWLDHAAGEIR